MARYRVNAIAVASAQVIVEADDPEEAIERAFAESGFPQVAYGAGYDLGDWTTASELFPDGNKPENDAELLPD